jgi:hypothetical protein
LALDPILAALSSTIKQIHATKVKTPTEKIPPVRDLFAVFAGLSDQRISYQSHQPQSYQSHQLQL